jgi:DNA (cytosine-5)-methyltransferase 1
VAAVAAASTDPVAFQTRVARNGRGAPSDVAPPLTAQAGGSGKGDAAPCVMAFANRTRDGVKTAEVMPGGLSPALTNPGDGGRSDAINVVQQMMVRRLTPTECERLQGFPDGHTKIPWNGKPADQCPDGPRYKAVGNSMAVPVIRWLGRRIEKIMGGK